MTSALFVDLFLVAGVLVELVCCLGLLLLRDSFDRLHCLGPAATLGPILIAAAVLVEHSSAQACIKIVLLVIFVLFINPVLTHATARAIRIRHSGHLDVREDDPEARP